MSRRAAKPSFSAVFAALFSYFYRNSLDIAENILYNNKTAEADDMIQTVDTKDFSMRYIKFGTGEQALAVIPGLSVKSVLLSEDQIKEMGRAHV